MTVFFEQFPDGANTYILTSDKKDAVIVDCASEKVYEFCINKGLQPKAVLLTHGHFDHVGGCGLFFDKNIPIFCGKDEEQYIFSSQNRGIFGGVYIPNFKITRTFSDGEKFSLAGMNFEVMETAGHTPGSVCYIVENCIFTGDTLFRGGIGRCDLAGGDYSKMRESLKKLFSLKNDYIIYSGHGEETTLEFERKNNIYADY